MSFRIHQAYIVQSALSWFPAFLESPASLIAPLRPIALGDWYALETEGQTSFTDRVYGYGEPPFIRCLGALSAAPMPDPEDDDDREIEEWVLPRLDAPRSGRGHLPYLVEANWSFRLLNPPPELPAFHLRPRLKLHLFPYGVVNALLCSEFFSAPGLEVGPFIRVLNALSHVRRGGERFEFEVAGGTSTGSTHPRHTTAQAMRALVDVLRQGLFSTLEAGLEPLAQAPRDAPLSTLLFLNDVEPAVCMEEYPRATCGLVTGTVDWQHIAARAAEPFATTDYGRYEGDYVKWGRLVSLVYVDRPEYRRYRRRLYWKLHSRVELARIEAFLFQVYAAQLERAWREHAPDGQGAWRAFKGRVVSAGEGAAAGEAQAGRRLRVKLYELFCGRFSIDELRILCFHLDINHESLSGDTIEALAVDLVRYCERRDQIAELIAQGEALRPDIAWPGPGVPGEPLADLFHFWHDLAGFSAQRLGGHSRVYRRAAELAGVEDKRRAFARALSALLPYGAADDPGLAALLEQLIQALTKGGAP